MAFDGLVTDDAVRRERWIGLFCASGLLAIWVAYILFTRLSVRTNFTPPDLLALRVGVGGLLMVPSFARLGFGHLKLGRALALALTGGIGFGALSYTGFVFAPVAHASALQTGALPLYTALLAFIVLGERFSRGRQIGLLLIVIGVVVMGYQSVSAGAPGQWRGDVLFSAASLVWAVYAVLAQRWRVRALQATAIVYVVSAILYVPVYLLFFEPRLLDIPIGQLALQALLQGVFANLGTMVLFTRVTHAFGAASTAMLSAAASLVVPVLGVMTLGEHPTPLAWAGLVCVVAGVIVAVIVVRPQKT